jgi:hypothetical protein
MVSTKKDKILPLIIFLYLALFPFGQLPKLLLELIGVYLFSNGADFLILGYFAYSLLNYDQLRALCSHKKYKATVSLVLFSLVLGTAIFGINLIAIFYAVRLIIYLYFFIKVSIYVSNHKKFRETLPIYLIVVGTCVGIFGLMQYLFIPDTRQLFVLGWDDHYYRLISTFLDPAFTGIILVLTILLTISYLKKRVFMIVGINMLALALTFSRASYLAGGIGIFLLSYTKFRNLRKIVLIMLCFSLLVLLLPKPAGEGVNLLRTKSIFLKLGNYQDALILIKQFPLFGVGFNFICTARGAILNQKEALSHSCSGIDNSILFIIATTGLVGGIHFVDLALHTFRNTTKKALGAIFILSSFVVVIHSLFTNTFFYPWVIGWLGFLWAISRTKIKEQK